MDYKIVNINERSPKLISQLVEIWEASVRATHTFLSEDEILRIKEYVPEALGGVANLAAAYPEDSEVAVGFMGVHEGCLEMLFIEPENRDTGIGKQLIQYGIENYGIKTVTVNEQNPQAVGFYEHVGFKTYKRSETDEQGGPYPILYMEL